MALSPSISLVPFLQWSSLTHIILIFWSIKQIQRERGIHDDKKQHIGINSSHLMRSNRRVIEALSVFVHLSFLQNDRKEMTRQKKTLTHPIDYHYDMQHEDIINERTNE